MARLLLIFRQHLFKNRLPLMDKALDTYAMRQRAIARNIANASSTEYHPEKVKFEEYFKDENVAAKGVTTHEQHLYIGKRDDANVQPELAGQEIPKPETYFAGESHVNIDKEMAELAQNQIKFRMVSRHLKNYFQGIQTAISGIIR